MTSFSIELGGDFSHLREIYPTNTEKIIGYCYKKGLNAINTTPKKKSIKQLKQQKKSWERTSNMNSRNAEE